MNRCLKPYRITDAAGRNYFKVSAQCHAAPEIVELVSPWGFKYKLTQEFREWLFGHCSYKIKVVIDDRRVVIEFPCDASAMAYKLRWV